jgi:hypothetical protein
MPGTSSGRPPLSRRRRGGRRKRGPPRTSRPARRLGEGDGQDDGPPGVQISGTASDLALFLWQRPVTGRLDVRGDSSLLERYFVLVPPV